MTFEEIQEIFETTGVNLAHSKDNALEGALVLQKYVPYVFQGADHDIVYGPDVEDVILAGITKEDAIKLASLNWMIYNEEYFACFV